jgi:hypothetical protein
LVAGAKASISVFASPVASARERAVFTASSTPSPAARDFVRASSGWPLPFSPKYGSTRHSAWAAERDGLNATDWNIIGLLV